MSWQPIETAPRDGSFIILSIAGRNEVLIGFWHRLHSAWWGQGGSLAEWKKWNKATHWMHLPEPPTN